MAALRSRCGHYIFALWFLLSIFFFFLPYSQSLQVGCLPCFYTWRGLSANLWCRFETCRTRLAEKDRTQKSPKIRHLCTIAEICWAISSQRRHISTIGKKIVKQQYLPHMSSQYGELQPTSGWDRFGCLGHPSKFQRVSRLGFVTASTSLNGSQPNVAQCLAVCWAGTLYIHFGGPCPLTEFCELQKSLCVQVLRSPILAALLHGTRAAAVSQTLWRDITELSQRAPPIFGGRPSRWESAHILVIFICVPILA